MDHYFNNVYISYITHLICIYCILYYILVYILLISYEYTVSYTIYCILPMPLVHIFICTYTHSIPLDWSVLGSCWGIVRYITALSELEAQAFRYTPITSDNHVTNNI
jgi:hypothetical protein